VPYVLFLYFIVTDAITLESLEADDEDKSSGGRYDHYHNPIPPTSQQSPWISGPNHKKYQFQVIPRSYEL
jgi:hypothetical protein